MDPEQSQQFLTIFDNLCAKIEANTGTLGSTERDTNIGGFLRPLPTQYPVFQGSKGEKVEYFVQEISLLLSVHRYPINDWVPLLISTLRGGALTWFNQAKATGELRDPID
jgi:hypothetical protein